MGLVVPAPSPPLSWFREVPGLAEGFCFVHPPLAKGSQGWDEQPSWGGGAQVQPHCSSSNGRGRGSQAAPLSLTPRAPAGHPQGHGSPRYCLYFPKDYLKKKKKWSKKARGDLRVLVFWKQGPRERCLRSTCRTASFQFLGHSGLLSLQGLP